MKKKSTIYIGTLGLATFLLSTAFTIKSDGEPVIGVFCGTPEKSSSGMNGRTQSPNDLLTNPNSCEGCHGGGSATPNITLSGALPIANGGTGNIYGTATSVATTNFTIAEVGGVLVFKYGATTIATMDSTGNLTTLNNMTAYGSI